MANPAHEALLRQGIAAWNEWRAGNHGVTPDLTALAMSAADLRRADLSHSKLRGAVLIRTRLEGSNLRYADLREAQLHEADLTHADLFRANLDDSLLAGAKLRRTRLFGASLRRSQITVADLRNSDCREADFEEADLREAVWTGASLVRANLTTADVCGCRLTECNLTDARGLTSRQLESAIVDETTLLSEDAAADASVDSLLRAVEKLKARSTGTTIAEHDVASFHALLVKLDSHGFQTAQAWVGDEELLRPVTSWDRTAGGQAFELAPLRAVDAKLFHQKLESVLKDIRRRLV